MRACVSRGGQDRLQFALTLLLLCGTKDFPLVNRAGDNQVRDRVC